MNPKQEMAFEKQTLMRFMTCTKILIEGKPFKKVVLIFAVLMLWNR